MLGLVSCRIGGRLAPLALMVVAGWMASAARADLAAEVQPSWECLAGKRETFTLTGSLRLPDKPDGGAGDAVEIVFARHGEVAFDLAARHPDHAFELRRRGEATALALPLQGRVYVGRGAVDQTDHLAPAGSLGRLVSPDSAAAVILPALAGQCPAALATLAEALHGLEPLAAPGTWGRAGLDLAFRDGGQVLARMNGMELTLALGTTCPMPAAAAAPAAVAEAVFPAADSLRPGAESVADAADCLAGLVWPPESFEVSLHEPLEGRGDLDVRFASPRPSGVARNDQVWMEWYRPRDLGPWPARAPACVVVHESGSRMEVGRLIARCIREHGIHAFLVQLPHYGRRRDPNSKPGPEKLIPAVTQAVADVRRARDAVAALPGVDASRISLQGTSLGGFVASTAAALDRGYAKTFIMLAGGDLPSVLANGRKDAAEVRAKLAAAGMTDRQIRDTLHAIEPLRLAHRLDGERTWLYSGRFDDVVPPANADLLAKAARLPEAHHVRLAADHYSGVLYLPIVLARVAQEILAP